MPSPLLLSLERRAGLGSYDTAKLLGLSSAGYLHMRSGRRPIRKYMHYHVEALMRLPSDDLKALVKARVHG